MDVVCKKCGYTHDFKVDVKDFSGFVCVNCHSYFKGTTLDMLTFVKEFAVPETLQWAQLAELVRFKKNSYWIITKIHRRSGEGEYVNEYVGLNNNQDDIYFSDGVDFTCALHTINREKVTLLPQSNICKFGHKRYKLTYTELQTVVYAEGFVFEDLESESTTNTYIHTINEDWFISQEFIDEDVQYYQGKYLEENEYYKLFHSYSNFLEKRADAAIKVRNIGLCVVLLLAALFWTLNWGQIGKDVYTFDEKYFGKKTNAEFVGSSFELKGTESRKLILEGISESKNYPIELKIKLVNEKTNEVIQTSPVVHENNDINYARGFTVDFCRVQPGIYHLVFVTSSPNSLNDMAVDFELNEDYKLTYGGKSYFILIVSLLGLVFLLGVFRYNMLSVKNRGFVVSKDRLSYIDVLKFNLLGVILILFFGGFSAVNIFVNSLTNCKTTLRTSSLEDHTYTGSRSHYYGSYRTYDGSGHK